MVFSPPAPSLFLPVHGKLFPRPTGWRTIAEILTILPHWLRLTPTHSVLIASSTWCYLASSNCGNAAYSVVYSWAPMLGRLGNNFGYTSLVAFKQTKTGQLICPNSNFKPEMCSCKDVITIMCSTIPVDLSQRHCVTRPQSFSNERLKSHSQTAI